MFFGPRRRSWALRLINFENVFTFSSGPVGWGTQNKQDNNNQKKVKRHTIYLYIYILESKRALKRAQLILAGKASTTFQGIPVFNRVPYMFLKLGIISTMLYTTADRLSWIHVEFGFVYLWTKHILFWGEIVRLFRTPLDVDLEAQMWWCIFCPDRLLWFLLWITYCGRFRICFVVFIDTPCGRQI